MYASLTAEAQVALVGNPNSGKTTLFNHLTKARKKTGNYPGITTEIYQGKMSIAAQTPIVLMDFPGAYSLFPNTSDEEELARLISQPQELKEISLFLYVIDITQLNKQLLLLTQLLDLGLPLALVLTMTDKIDEDKANSIVNDLEANFHLPTYRSQHKIVDLKHFQQWISDQVVAPQMHASKQIYSLSADQLDFTEEITSKSDYANYITALFTSGHTLDQKTKTKWQIDETLARYNFLKPLENKVLKILSPKQMDISDRLDRVLTHPYFGPLIFTIVLLFTFQLLFTWSAIPMDFIDAQSANLAAWIDTVVTQPKLRSFLNDGLLAGITGVVIFVPQIILLFIFIGLLEQSGYLARTVYLSDHLMKRFGMSGRSTIALLSSSACAIPAIMSTRSIEHKNERLATILSTPFISCSARIPVYTMLIGIAIPATKLAGVFDLRALTFIGLYILSLIATLLTSKIVSMFLNSKKNNSNLVLDLPAYQIPNFKDILVLAWHKTKMFVLEAGKIIFIISIILWFLGSYGPTEAMKQAEAQAMQQAQTEQLTEDATQKLMDAKKLEASYAGHIGKWIEPVVEPLGYDWQIGVALLASFAAREVFVGTLATIYSIGEQTSEEQLINKLAGKRKPDSDALVFSFATSMSLLIFFLLAMQCMSTLAVVKRETKSWKWPLLQLFGMTGLAYICAFLVYQFLSN